MVPHPVWTLPSPSPDSLAPLRRRYKPSSYNVFLDRGDRVWGCNTRSGALVRLTHGQNRTVQALLGGEEGVDSDREGPELLRGLLRGQFLVPRDLDEMELLKVRNRLTRFAARGLGLVIAPTLRCNFRCPYCYVDLNANKMSPGARDRVKRFFARKLDEGTKASVCWTGGDPSLAMDVVTDLSDSFQASCREKGCDYDAVMITNGFLLDRKMLDGVRRSGIHALQITFDGGREHHDATRSLAGGAPTYDRILDNVAAACGEVRINVRINVDGRNRRSVGSLLEDLGRLGAGNLSVYFAHVQVMNERSAPHRDDCLSAQGFAELEPELLRRAFALGLQVSSNALRRQVGAFCGANSNNHFVVDARARLQKCYDDLGQADTQGIGYIDETGDAVVDKQANLLHWLSWDPFEVDECRSCRVLPMCMGGCSYHAIRNETGIGPGCLKLRYNLETIIELYGERLGDKAPGTHASGAGLGADCTRCDGPSHDEGR